LGHADLSVLVDYEPNRDKLAAFAAKVGKSKMPSNYDGRIVPEIMA
jgi:hypothetical protein